MSYWCNYPADPSYLTQGWQLFFWMIESKTLMIMFLTLIMQGEFHIIEFLMTSLSHVLKEFSRFLHQIYFWRIWFWQCFAKVHRGIGVQRRGKGGMQKSASRERECVCVWEWEREREREWEKWTLVVKIEFSGKQSRRRKEKKVSSLKGEISMLRRSTEEGLTTIQSMLMRQSYKINLILKETKLVPNSLTVC